MSGSVVVSGSHLEIACEVHGHRTGWPVVLLHGFPYDPRCFDAAAEILAADGAHVVVPYLRGYGSTAYRDDSVMRSGQQAALAHDLRDVIDGLLLDKPIVAGFDWGGRAACVASALWPEMISGLVTVSGYNIQDIARMAVTSSPPDVERRLWYQWYLHSERGRLGLTERRREFTRQLWQEWSPQWNIPHGAFEATATSFDHPDFVSTVVHSYRHRYALTDGDPAYAAAEEIIARQPTISVPTVVIDATEDPLSRPRPPTSHAHRFSTLSGYRRLSTGHNVPQEDPSGFADAVQTLHRAASA